MTILIVSIFPELFEPVVRLGMVGRAVKRSLLQVECIDLRDHASDRHRTVDDRPFGGGEGMVFKPGPLAAAIRYAKARAPQARVVFMSPQGARLDQAGVKRLSTFDLVLVCGRYEGIDQRVVDMFADEEVSVGDYVLSGGETAAMVLIDAAARLIPGVVGHPDSIRNESFEAGWLDCPVYTRPPVFEGVAVPAVLLSGNHRDIREWRRREAVEMTKKKRPDLLDGNENQI